MMPKETAQRRAARGLPPFLDAPKMSNHEHTPPVTLRSSCNECIKLKRACRWEPPSPPQKIAQLSNNDTGEGAATAVAPVVPAIAPSCLLCTRMGKVCSRSMKKRSGPPKGTKYTRKTKKKDGVPSATTTPTPMPATTTIGQPTRKKHKKQEEKLLENKSDMPSTLGNKPHANDTSPSSAPSCSARKGSEIIMSDKKSSLIIERAQVRSMEGAKKGDERKKEEGLAVAEEGSPAEVEDGARLLLHMVSAASSVTWASDMPVPLGLQEQRLPSLVALDAMSPSAQGLRGLGGGFFRVPAAAQYHHNLPISHAGLKRHGVLRLVNPSLSRDSSASFQHHHGRYTPTELYSPRDAPASLDPWGMPPPSCVFNRCAQE